MPSSRVPRLDDSVRHAAAARRRPHRSQRDVAADGPAGTESAASRTAAARRAARRAARSSAFTQAPRASRCGARRAAPPSHSEEIPRSEAMREMSTSRGPHGPRPPQLDQEVRAAGRGTAGVRIEGGAGLVERRAAEVLKRGHRSSVPGPAGGLDGGLLLERASGTSAGELVAEQAVRRWPAGATRSRCRKSH